MFGNNQKFNLPKIPRYTVTCIATLIRLAKKEESNHSINLKAFKESLYRTNEESRSNEMVQHQVPND